MMAEAFATAAAVAILGGQFFDGPRRVACLVLGGVLLAAAVVRAWA